MPLHLRCFGRVGPVLAERFEHECGPAMADPRERAIKVEYDVRDSGSGLALQNDGR